MIEIDPGGRGRLFKKEQISLWHWGRKICSVHSDHDLDRELVARKIIAKEDIITRFDSVLHKHKR
jgi:hypothetical protein